MAAIDLVNLSALLDDAKCFALVRQHRWREGVRCPGCGSDAVIRNGCDERPTSSAALSVQGVRRAFRRPRRDSAGRTPSAAAGVGALPLPYGSEPLEPADRPGAKESSPSDAQAMTEQLRRGLVARIPEARLAGEVEIDEVYVVAGHKGQPAAVAKRGARGGDAS